MPILLLCAGKIATIHQCNYLQVANLEDNSLSLFSPSLPLSLSLAHSLTGLCRFSSSSLSFSLVSVILSSSLSLSLSLFPFSLVSLSLSSSSPISLSLEQNL
ncbi:unnamed protein product [Prunus brigantina]